MKQKKGPSEEGPICLGSLWLGEVGADALIGAGCISQSCNSKLGCCVGGVAGEGVEAR